MGEKLATSISKKKHIKIENLTRLTKRKPI